MANAAFRDVSFMLRRSHNEQVAKIPVSYTHLELNEHDYEKENISICIERFDMWVIYFMQRLA